MACTSSDRSRDCVLENENDVVGGATVDVSNVRQVQVGEETPSGGSMRPVYGPELNAYVHAFLLTIDGTRQRMRDLGALPAFPDTIETAISEDLTIFGYSGNESVPKRARAAPATLGRGSAGMTDLGSSHTELGMKEDIDCYGYGANDAGVTVGRFRKNAALGQQAPAESRCPHRPASGWHLTFERGINRIGTIVGTG